jgi:hypothetical protein
VRVARQHLRLRGRHDRAVQVVVSVSPGRTGATKRTWCSTKPIAVPWKYMPSGAPMIADVITPCRMRPP